MATQARHRGAERERAQAQRIEGGATGLVVGDVLRGRIGCAGMVPQGSIGGGGRRCFMRNMAHLAWVLVGVGLSTPGKGGDSHPGEVSSSSGGAEIVFTAYEACLANGRRQRQHCGYGQSSEPQG